MGVKGRAVSVVPRVKGLSVVVVQDVKGQQVPVVSSTPYLPYPPLSPSLPPSLPLPVDSCIHGDRALLGALKAALSGILGKP